jgi:uncharacterized protein
MDNKLKGVLGLAVVVAVFIFAFSYSAYVNTYSQSAQPSSYRTFSVAGEGKITAIPDVAQFTFSIITEGGKNIADLQKTNTDKNNKATDYLKSLGVKDEDIKTLNYSLSPRYQTYSCNYKVEIGSVPCPPSEIIGYTITLTTSVKVRDFTKIGDAMAGVVDKGANSVSSLYFTIDDQTAFENQARDKAIAQAREKADKIAKAGGFRVGKLLSIEEGYASYYYGKGGVSAIALEDSVRNAPAPNLEPGSQEVSVNVTLRYEIK